MEARLGRPPGQAALLTCGSPFVSAPAARPRGGPGWSWQRAEVHGHDITEQVTHVPISSVSRWGDPVGPGVPSKSSYLFEQHLIRTCILDFFFFFLQGFLGKAAVEAVARKLNVL